MKGCDTHAPVVKHVGTIERGFELKVWGNQTKFGASGFARVRAEILPQPPSTYQGTQMKAA